MGGLVSEKKYDTGSGANLVSNELSKGQISTVKR